MPKAGSVAYAAGYGNGSVVVGRRAYTSAAREGQKGNRVTTTASITNLGAGLAAVYRDNASDQGRVNVGVIHVISDIDTLILAYELLKSKPGNMTPGLDPGETLDGTGLRGLQRLSQKLRSGKFRFSPARRTYIPKPGRVELRPLTVPSPREKLVQKALALVLEGIYEPIFRPTSHGFRPGRGTHTALRMIDNVCKNANWFIEADISKCFESLDHGTLLASLRSRIACDKTLALLRSALRSGYATSERGLAVRADSGTPQGSVLSPILCNILMHPLDVFMDRLMARENRGTRRRQNPAYTKLMNALAKTSDVRERRRLRSAMRRIPASDPMDPNMIRVRYVRYADDLIISVIGPHSLAARIKGEVEAYLSDALKLQVNPTKSVLTNTRVRAAKFLGTRVRTGKPSAAQKPVTADRHGRRVRVTPRVSLHAPIDEIYAKLKSRGFVKGSGNHGGLTPTGLGRLVNMDHADILAYYNSVGRGVLNYYSFADNRKSLGSVVRALQMSCARTLALKYKLRRAAQVFKRYGKLLRDPASGRTYELLGSYRRTRTFQTRAPLALAALEKSWAAKLTRSRLHRSCAVCGATPVEMHHVRRLRGLKRRTHLDWFTMQMAAINRKQVPLCKDHHRKLHAGKLSDIERAAFAEGCRTTL